MRRRRVAVAVAVIAAVVIVGLRWRSLVPPPVPELPSSHAITNRTPPTAVGLAVLRVDDADDDEISDWHITGRVIEHGRPVAAARVAVDGQCMHGSERLGPVLTDADGRFTLEAVPGCSYWLVADHDGSSARVLFAVLPTEPIEVSLTRDNDIVVHVVDAATRAPVKDARAMEMLCDHPPCAPLGGPDGIVRLQRAHRIRLSASGYADTAVDLEDTWHIDGVPTAVERIVEFHALHHIVGRIVGPAGEPVSGMPLLAAHPGQIEPAFVTARTDNDGRFDLLAPLGSTVQPNFGECIDGHRGGFQAVDVKDDSPLELQVPRWVPCTPQPPPRPDHPHTPPPESDLVITVVDDAGRPVPGAEVWNFRQTLRPGHTDARGQFVFRTHGATDDLYARRGKRMSPVAVVEAGHAYTLRLQPAAITGTVVDSDGEPVANAWLRVRLPFLTSRPNYREIRTDDDGHFGFVLPPGRYLISAFRETSIDDSYDAPNAIEVATDTRDVTFEIP